MHMLHELLRDPTARDPDERFRGLLQSILTGYRFRALSTADFQHAVERIMTPSMDIEEDHSMNWFFDQWVRGTGIPHYSVQFQARPSKQGFMVTGKLLQGDVNDVFTEPVPIYASRSGEKPELLGVVVTTGPETHFHFTSRFRPGRLLIDPKLTVLCRTN
jgi:aminopeptidase N